MSFVRGNRICETSTTTGTGAYVLDGAVIGYFPFSSKCVEGSICEYAVEAIDAHGALTGGCEVGLGTFGPGNTLARIQVYTGSNATDPVSWASGTKRISLTLAAESLEKLPGLTASSQAAAIELSTINSRLDLIDRITAPLVDASDFSNFLTAYQLNN